MCVCGGGAFGGWGEGRKGGRLHAEVAHLWGGGWGVGGVWVGFGVGWRGFGLWVGGLVWG